MTTTGLRRSSHQRWSVKKSVIRNFTKFTGKHLRQSLFFNKKNNFFKKETLTQVFSCEFCEISKNTFSIEHLRTTASGLLHFEKIWISKSIARPSSNWANYRHVFWETSQLVNISRANVNYVFIDLSNVKIPFLRR